MIAGTVIEHGGPGALMGSNLPSMLELAAIGEIGGDASGAKGMAGEGRGEMVWGGGEAVAGLSLQDKTDGVVPCPNPID